MTLGQRISKLAGRGASRGCVAGGLILVLAACSQNKDSRIAFDGVFFKTKASRIDDDRAVFAASASKASLSPDGARQAAAYEALRYCIENFGTSRILWTTGPDIAPESLISDKNVLTLQGECNP